MVKNEEQVELETRVKNIEKTTDNVEKRMEDLEKELRANKVDDQKRHEELKILQAKQHEDDNKWNQLTSFGTLATPLVIAFGPLLEKWFGKNQPKMTNIVDTEK